MDYWTTLGIAPTKDRKAIKKAYAAILKTTKPDDDPDGYQRLRQAYDWAIDYCKTNSIDTNQQQIPEPSPAEHAELNSHDKASLVDSHNFASRNDVNTDIAESNMISGIHENDSVEQSHSPDQKAYQSANTAINLLFSNNTIDLCSQFKSIITSIELFNFKTRHYFEAMLLEALCHFDGKDMPYELVESAAEEFKWFVEQQTNVEMQHRISYLEYRLQAHKAYKDYLCSDAKVGIGTNQFSARMLLGKYRPRYFRIVHFLGILNRPTRKYTNYFSNAVEQGICPELDTKTFHWWDESLQKSLFSLWHSLVGALIFVVLSSWLKFKTYSDDYYLIMYFGILGTTLIIWGGDWSARHLYPKVLSWWRSVQGSIFTNFFLLVFFVLSILVWREFPDHPFRNWLIALSLTVSALRFGIYGTFMVLGFALVYVFCLAFLDPLKKYQFLSSFALIIGFITQHLLVLSLEKVTRRIAPKISENGYAIWSIGICIAIALSYIYISLSLYFL